jgi:hypothetical protein
VTLDADPSELARAGSVAATIGVPVDVTVALSHEAISSAETDDLETLLLGVMRCAGVASNPPQDMARWVSQLRHGSRWTESELPQVIVPARIGIALARDCGPSVRLAGDVRRLRLLLNAEAATASAQDVGIGEALRQLRHSTGRLATPARC